MKAPGPGGSVPGRGGSRVWDNNQQEEEQIQDDEPQANEDDDNQPRHQPLDRPPHPRVHQSVQRDHLVDNILGSIRGNNSISSNKFLPILLICFLLRTT